MQRLCCLVDGFANTGERAAATRDTLHGLVDIAVGRMAMTIKQRGCGDQLRALTIAALHDIAFDPGFLQRASFRRIQSFNGDDFRFIDRAYGYLASLKRYVIDQDRACAANANAAAEFGSCQFRFEFASECPEQGSFWGRMHNNGFSVNTD